MYDYYDDNLVENFKLKCSLLLPVPFVKISVVVEKLLPPSSITPSSDTQELWFSLFCRRVWLGVQSPVSGFQVSQVLGRCSPPQTWKPSWLCSSRALGILTKWQDVLVLGTNISVLYSVPSPPVIRRPKKHSQYISDYNILFSILALSSIRPEEQTPRNHLDRHSWRSPRCWHSQCRDHSRFSPSEGRARTVLTWHNVKFLQHKCLITFRLEGVEDGVVIRTRGRRTHLFKVHGRYLTYRDVNYTMIKIKTKYLF